MVIDHKRSSRVRLFSWGEGGSLALNGHRSGDIVTMKTHAIGVLLLTIRFAPLFPIGLIKTESES